MRGVIIAICLLTWVSGALAEGPLWQANFDAQIPGEQPRGWGHYWGEQGDDLMTVSNMESVSGKNSFLLDRTGTNEAMWGWGVGLPAVTAGTVVLSWCFRVHGRGNDAHFGWEIRYPNGRERVAVVGVGDRGVVLQSGNWQNSVLLGRCEEDTWVRVTLELPTRDGKQTQSFGQLEQRQDDGTWQAGERRAVPFVGANPPVYGVLEMNTSPDKRNYLVYMDDFRMEMRPGP